MKRLKKIIENKWAFWAGIIYASSVLLFSVFSIGHAILTIVMSFGFLANLIFSVLLIPVVLFVFAVNFLVGFIIGDLIGKLVRRLR